ncbi:MAG: HAD family hydrolase [Chloroflexi bacterium]|nr:HAD family hydrolase [Chloroflexota bacterium]
MPRPAVFLDRDGVLNRQPPPHHYVTSPAELVLLPRAAQGLALLKSQGYLLVVVTNQQGIGRGLMRQEDLHTVHTALSSKLHAYGATLDGIYACPHLAAEGCLCRKPRPGLLHRAAGVLDIALEESVMIGDSPEDLKAGEAAGCRTLVHIHRTGCAEGPVAHHCLPSLWQASRWIIAHHTPGAVNPAPGAAAQLPGAGG